MPKAAQALIDRLRAEHVAEGIRADHVLPGSAEFDELVVGQWLHVEAQDATRWWMNVGGVTVWVTVDRDGRAKKVTVYGPGDYARPVPGCEYDVDWSAE